MLKNFSAIRFILVRYLFSSFRLKKKGRQQTAVGVVVPVMGVWVGVFAFTVVLSIMGGFVKNLKNRLLVLQPHIEVNFKHGVKPALPKEVYLKKISTLSSHIQAVSSYQRGSVILSSSDHHRALMAVLEGIEPKVFEDIIPLQKYLIMGSHFSVLSQKLPASDVESSEVFPTVLLGYDLMRQLGLYIGDRATLISIQMDEGPFGAAPEQFPVVIGGALSTGNFAYDQKLIFTSFDVASQFFKKGNEWSGFYLKIKDPLDVDIVVKEI
ncbi:MAG: ABC transporter permease, partial [Silvanigrellaceae bacterium]|nr:ABC transporter permease [Silvanigrellaceae bacterium]